MSLFSPFYDHCLNDDDDMIMIMVVVCVILKTREEMHIMNIRKWEIAFLEFSARSQSNELCWESIVEMWLNNFYGTKSY